MKNWTCANVLKILVWLPALVMMFVIFSFSSQSREQSGSLSMDISRTIVRTGDRLLDRDMTENQIEAAAHRIEHPLRKCAHVTEYCVLASSLMISLYVWGVRGKRLLSVVLLITVLFAAGDEYHQYLVGDRGPSVRDVVIDTCGAMAGIIASGILLSHHAKKRTHRH